MAVAPSAQHPDGVDRGDQEAGDDVRGEDHVWRRVGDRAVDERVQRVDIRHGAV
jgi:hypothetical protein